jgi:hypothetical protein
MSRHNSLTTFGVRGSIVASSQLKQPGSTLTLVTRRFLTAAIS